MSVIFLVDLTHTFAMDTLLVAHTMLAVLSVKPEVAVTKSPLFGQKFFSSVQTVFEVCFELNCNISSLVHISMECSLTIEVSRGLLVYKNYFLWNIDNCFFVCLRYFHFLKCKYCHFCRFINKMRIFMSTFKFVISELFWIQTEMTTSLRRDSLL